MKRLCGFLLPIALGVLLAVGLMLTMHTGQARAVSTPTQPEVIHAGLAYLKTQQQPDGGITGFSGVADPDTTARSVIAYVATGAPLDEVVSAEGNSMIGYLTTQAVTFTHDTTNTLFPGRAGEVLAAVSIAGEDASTFGGMDLVKEINSSFHPDTGAYSTTAKQDFSSGAASDQNQAWAILGLGLAGQSVPEAATQYLVKSQAEDGSWGGGDPDTTGLAVTALISSQLLSPKDATIQKAIGFFHTTQLDSGGWRPSWDTDPLNADSTGWILQALVSVGEDPRGASWIKNNSNPIDALLGLHKPDGAIGGTYANTYSTAEAIIGLSGSSLASLGKAAATQRVGLVVFPGDNSAFTECISYTGNSFTGLQLLQRSSLTIETATNPTQGTAVCKIGEVGDASNNCFGSMPDYWAYFSLGANGWEYSPVGADKSLVADGGVYAWSWGTGNPPPMVTFQNVCEGVAFSLPTATAAAATATTTLLPTSTAVLMATPLSLATQQPTATPVAGTNTSSYIIYGVVILALAILVIYLMIRRRR